MVCARSLRDRVRMRGWGDAKLSPKIHDGRGFAAMVTVFFELWYYNPEVKI